LTKLNFDSSFEIGEDLCFLKHVVPGGSTGTTIPSGTCQVTGLGKDLFIDADIHWPPLLLIGSEL
jgi:hypothetical protein